MNNNKIKILNIITGISGGGSETMLFNLQRFDLKNTHIIVCLKKKNVKYQKKFKNILYLNITKNPISIIFGIIKLINVIKEKKPNIIMSWLYHADIFNYIACKLVNFSTKKIIWNIRCAHMDNANLPLNTIIIRYILSKLSKNVGTILSNSFEAKKYHKFLGYRNNNWKIIPNGFDIKKYKKNFSLAIKTKKKLFLKKEKIIGMIARNEPQKNFNFFLKELTIFKKKNNFDFKIFFIGKNTDKIILEPILKKNVIKFGYLKNIYPIINILDYLILISKGESFPNVVGEAMCMNVPCITNNVGDCKKIIGNSGIVINNNKLNNLSKVLSEVFENKFKFLNGRERIIKYYRIEIICQQFEKLFNDIVYKN